MFFFASSALLHGIGWAVWFTAAPNVLATWFGVADLGGTVRTLYTALGFGALAGPAVLGFVIDGSGYEIAIAMVMVTSAIAWALASFPNASLLFLNVRDCPVNDSGRTSCFFNHLENI